MTGTSPRKRTPAVPARAAEKAVRKASSGEPAAESGKELEPAEHLCVLTDALVRDAVARHNQRGEGDVVDASTSLAAAFGAFPAGKWLAVHYDLDQLEAAVLAVLLAMELDPTYGAACAYLQDNAALQRPSVDLTLKLLGLQRRQRLSARARLQVGTLWRDQLVQQEPTHAGTPAAQPVRLDSQVLALFLPRAGVDDSLATFCQLTTARARLAGILLDPAARAALAPALSRRTRPLFLLLRGRPGSGKGALAAVLAAEHRLHLLIADVAALPSSPHERLRLLQRACREARLRGALLFCRGLDAFEPAGRRAVCADLVEALAAFPVHCAVGMHESWPAEVRAPGGLLHIEVSSPDVPQRAALWKAAAQARAHHIEPNVAQALAARFRLSALQIAQAVDDCVLVQESTSASDDSSPLGFEDCAAAARALSGHALEQLARRITPSATWKDLILPADVEQQLRELSQRVQQLAPLALAWGTRSRLTSERGVTALFAGPSGTGKTLAAEVIAADLGLDLFCVDLALLVSKYIGETEKNLDRVFEAAETANAVLFFDEADALFGKRSEVKDAHDRYANLEIAYLLQKMEQFEGLAILATNLRQNIDDAFTRRVTFAVNFPFPQEAERLRLWEAHWPAPLARSPQFDFDELARALPLSGGNIRNLVLAAAHYATTDARAVERSHVLRATQREYQKMGKTLGDGDWRRLGLLDASSAEHVA